MEEEKEERRKPVAVFMAFGTKGDVYPIAAITASFARDQKQYDVILITHSAHETLSSHLAKENAAYFPISSPPVLSPPGDIDTTGFPEIFALQKRAITWAHRRECYSAIKKIFGNGPSMGGDFIVINLFALEGWSLAEAFCIRCMVAAPYVVPYSAPSTFECKFRKELPELYQYLKQAPFDKVCWKDVIHWMWPLFTETFGSWRSGDLNLSSCPFMDPVTDLPTWHAMPQSPLLLYGFSKEVVECPDYWPSNVRVCGFWSLPYEWQFSCKSCGEISAASKRNLARGEHEFCSAHMELQSFLKFPTAVQPIFIGLSSIGSMGFLRNPQAFLQVLQTVLEITSYRFILFTDGYGPLDAAIRIIATESSSNERKSTDAGISLFDDRLFCFSGGSTAAALQVGIPQIICPFMLDQFYWAEKMFWLGVAPEPVERNHLVPEKMNDSGIRKAAIVLSKAIHDALSPRIKACALRISERISCEDGVSEAVKLLREEICC